MKAVVRPISGASCLCSVLLLAQLAQALALLIYVVICLQCNDLATARCHNLFVGVQAEHSLTYLSQRVPPLHTHSSSS